MSGLHCPSCWHSTLSTSWASGTDRVTREAALLIDRCEQRYGDGTYNGRLFRLRLYPESSGQPLRIRYLHTTRETMRPSRDVDRKRLPEHRLGLAASCGSGIIVLALAIQEQIRTGLIDDDPPLHQTMRVGLACSWL